MKNYGLLSKEELKNLTKEELKEAREYLIREKEYNNEIIDDKESNSNQVSEAYKDNEDINERLDIVNNKIEDEPTLK